MQVAGNLFAGNKIYLKVLLILKNLPHQHQNKIFGSLKSFGFAPKKMVCSEKLIGFPFVPTLVAIAGI
jgi:hypothetical protein